MTLIAGQPYRLRGPSRWLGVATAVAATLAAVLPWTRLHPGGSFYVLLGADGPDWLPGFLRWSSLKPPVAVLVLLALASWLLVIAGRRRRWAAPLMLPLTLTCLAVLALSSPVPWPWSHRAAPLGVSVSPGLGYWLSLLALALAAAVTASALFAPRLSPPRGEPD